LFERIVYLVDEIVFQIDIRDPSPERRNTLRKRLDYLDDLAVEHFGQVYIPD
jgi:hypothetical protein